MSFDVRRTLEDLAGEVDREYDRHAVVARARVLRRRRWLIRAMASVPALLLVVGGANVVVGWVAGNEGANDRDRRLPAARPPSVTDSPTDSNGCGWESMKPYLESLLEAIGGPEGVDIDSATMSPSQNGIRLHPQEYEGRLDVFVTSDNEKDPLNKSTRGVDIASHHGGFTVYRNRHPESDVVIAADDSTAWTMSMVAYPYSGSVVWADRAAPVAWMIRAIDYSNAHTPPSC